MTLAERINNGENAAQIGITPTEYAARKATLGRFLAHWSGKDFDGSYRQWLTGEAEGDRGTSHTAAPTVSQTQGGPTGPLTLTIARARRPCGHCGGGRVR